MSATKESADGHTLVCSYSSSWLALPQRCLLPYQTRTNSPLGENTCLSPYPFSHRLRPLCLANCAYMTCGSCAKRDVSSCKIWPSRLGGWQQAQPTTNAKRCMQIFKSVSTKSRLPKAQASSGCLALISSL